MKPRICVDKNSTNDFKGVTLVKTSLNSNQIYNIEETNLKVSHVNL